MNNPSNQPEQTHSPERQKVEGRIKQKYNRLKWYQRSVGAVCLVLGTIGCYLDNKQVAEGELDVPFTLAALPFVAGASGGTIFGRRRTRKSCEKLVEEYALSKQLDPERRLYRTDVFVGEDGKPALPLKRDEQADLGVNYDNVQPKPIRFLTPLKETCMLAGGVGLNGFVGDFPIAPEFAGIASGIGVGGAGTWAVLQMVDETSIGLHLASYEAQLNNIDSAAVFGRELPPPPET